MTLEELFTGRNIDIPATQLRMKGLMDAEGLPYGERTMTYNSGLAQELAKWAERLAGGQKIHNALFQAYFVDGVNLANIDNLIGIAGQIGLSAVGAKEVLEERQFHEAVDADWRRSRGLGITGVPTFVVRNRALVGARPYEQLEALVMSAGS